MKKNNLIIISIIGVLTLSACGGDEDKAANSGKGKANAKTSAEIVIGDAKHQFSGFKCFKGFNNDLGVLLSNDKVFFEVSQLRPSDNTWTVKLYKGDFSGDGSRMSKIDKADEYFTRKYDIIRGGSKIMGTAKAERGKLPRNLVDINIDITCQKMK